MIIEDFALEDLYNKRFEKWIENLGWKAFRMEGCFSWYDYMLICRSTGEYLPVELKTDRMASNTGNFCIEFERVSVKGETVQTGINVTKSKFYVYNVITDSGYTQYWISVRKLKKLLSEEPYRIVKGGDGYRTSMYLIPITELVSRLSPKVVEHTL